MSTISAQVIFIFICFFVGFMFIGGWLGEKVSTLQTLEILTKTEVVLSQNDVNLTTAFEGEDIPNFGVFTDHQVP